MSDSLQDRLQATETRFNALKTQEAKQSQDLELTQQEIFRVQGEFRLLQDLVQHDKVAELPEQFTPKKAKVANGAH